ncbi:MAG: hypothetical protein ACPG97_10375, partial [Paracoccaceae bacterium]
CAYYFGAIKENITVANRKKHVSPRVRLIKEAQNTNSVDKLRKLVGMPVDNNNYLCDTNFLR